MRSDRPVQDGIAHVLIGVAVDTVYSYRIPAGLQVEVGDFVDVPLGTRGAIGVVWETSATIPEEGLLKSIAGKRDLPALRRELRQLIDWVANWTLAPRGMVLRMAIRAPERAGAEKPRIAVRFSGKFPERMTPARARVVEAAQPGGALTKSALAELAGCSAAVIDALVDAGTLQTLALPAEPVAGEPQVDFATTDLETSQKSAADHLVQSVEGGEFSACLLEGVTGSGKTEVYFEAVAAALRRGRQVLIMVPEIALTAQFLERFARRFGAVPAEWHSGITAQRKARIWSGVAAGEVKVVAGARSALLLPFAALGLIVVDEEHDAAYKQDDGVAYHARDMAVVRARLERAVIILASATPSLETRVNAAQGRYHHIRLAARFGGRALPAVTIIDLRNQPASRGRWISPPLAAAIGETIAKRQQALLFLNRRGYAPLTLCRRCGHRFQCPNCSAWLVEHRFRRALLCHHCGHLEQRPRDCPQCLAEDSLQACGPGIERLAEEVAGLFPAARTLVLSSDFAGGIERLKRELSAVEQGLFDIIIGTQLVAKGHHFPQLSLAAIIDADVGLSNGDPRAAERTFQLLAQVTGRAGRGTSPGRGLVQSWQPEHPVMQAIVSGDSERFYREEIAVRQRAGLPPFGRLAALIVSANDRSMAESHARLLVRVAGELPPSARWRLARDLAAEGELVLLGPAEAPIAVLRGRHRFRLLVKAPRQADLQGFLRALLAQSPPARGSVRVAVDVDPQSFL
jgi:primosomal protein N' (replication factor Y) (superfamily II helicase)